MRGSADLWCGTVVKMPVLASASPSHTVADDGRPKINNMLCHCNLNFSPNGGTIFLV